MGEDEQEPWHRSGGEGDELRDFGKKWERTPLFLRILPFHNTNVELSTSRMQREKTKSKRAQGQVGWPRSVDGRPHLAPQNSGIFPKISL
jgi:hypothetical protein